MDPCRSRGGLLCDVPCPARCAGPSRGLSIMPTAVSACQLRPVSWNTNAPRCDTPRRLPGRPMSPLFRSLLFVLLAARAVPACAGSHPIVDACDDDVVFKATFEPGDACRYAPDD